MCGGGSNDLEGIMRNPLDCNLAFAGALMAGVAFAAAPALAQEASNTSNQPQAQETQVAEQTREPTVLVCKVLAVTGSRIEHEYCLTEEDWEAIREDSRRTIERLMNAGTETGTGV
jgi:hypothetical protein